MNSLAICKDRSVRAHWMGLPIQYKPTKYWKWYGTIIKWRTTKRLCTIGDLSLREIRRKRHSNNMDIRQLNFSHRKILHRDYWNSGSGISERDGAFGSRVFIIFLVFSVFCSQILSVSVLCVFFRNIKALLLNLFFILMLWPHKEYARI